MVMEMIVDMAIMKREINVVKIYICILRKIVYTFEQKKVSRY